VKEMIIGFVVPVGMKRENQAEISVEMRVKEV